MSCTEIFEIFPPAGQIFRTYKDSSTAVTTAVIQNHYISGGEAVSERNGSYRRSGSMNGEGPLRDSYARFFALSFFHGSTCTLMGPRFRGYNDLVFFVFASTFESIRASVVLKTRG
jgi:hypothetical protein